MKRNFFRDEISAQEERLAAELRPIFHMGAAHEAMPTADGRLLLGRDRGFDAFRRRCTADALGAAERDRRLDVARDVRRRFALVGADVSLVADLDADRLFLLRLAATALLSAASPFFNK